MGGLLVDLADVAALNVAKDLLDRVFEDWLLAVGGAARERGQIVFAVIFTGTSIIAAFQRVLRETVRVCPCLQRSAFLDGVMRLPLQIKVKE